MGECRQHVFSATRLQKFILQEVLELAADPVDCGGGAGLTRSQQALAAAAPRRAVAVTTGGPAPRMAGRAERLDAGPLAEGVRQVCLQVDER